MDKVDEDLLNLKFKDLRDDIRHEAEQRDEFLNHAYSIDRRLRAIERCCQEYFGIDPTSTAYAEEEVTQRPTCGAKSATEGQANAGEGGTAPQAGGWLAAYETQEALAAKLFSVFHNEPIEDAAKAMEVSPRYGQWLKLAFFIKHHQC